MHPTLPPLASPDGGRKLPSHRSPPHTQVPSQRNNALAAALSASASPASSSADGSLPHEASPSISDASLARLAVGARIEMRTADGSVHEAKGKAALVLAMLALEERMNRRRLAFLLWPDSSEAQSRSNLRTLVHRLNQRFGAELLAGNDQLRLEQVIVILHDTESVLSMLEHGGAQRCELLSEAGIDGDADPSLTLWLQSARQRLRRIQVNGLCEALSAALAEGKTERAIVLANGCVQLEPLSEHWHRQLMDTLEQCGERSAALLAYENCKRLLMDQLGVLPDVQTRTVQLRILQGQARDEPANPVAEGLSPLGGAARYPLVERESMLADVQAALAHGQHVVLQGEAGVGKTRLLRTLADRSGVEQLSFSSGQRHEPYAALAQLVQELQHRRMVQLASSDQAELARLAPTAFPAAPHSDAPLTAPSLHAALRQWMQQLATAGVRWIVLDNLHDADAGTQQAIAALTNEPADAHRLPRLILGYRSGEIDDALDAALLSAQLKQHARCFTLTRLSLRGVQNLLEAMDDGSSAQRHAELAEHLLKRTGGNPLFVIELAQHALSNDPDAASIAGTNLDALLRARLTGCSESALQLACIAGIAAEDFTVELASAVMGQPSLQLMRPWSELQQRGLFADHGLAHDLVREAVLGLIPQAISRALHSQIAGHLEAAGVTGVRLLNHWLAAENFDRALPHLMRQLHATSAAGLSAVHLEIELLGVMEKLSDSALVENLWCSAEIYGTFHEYVPSEVWPRMSALVSRVAQLVDETDDVAASWLSFERARVIFCRDRAIWTAYRLLSGVAERMATCGVPRARSELVLADMLGQATESTGEHARRAKAATQGMARELGNLRLLNYVDAMLAKELSPMETARNAVARRREARRTGSKPLDAAVRHEIAAAFTQIGRYRTANRYYFDALRPGDPEATGVVVMDPVAEGQVALNTGRFDIAADRFERLAASCVPELRPVYLALLALRLGQWAKARVLADEVDTWALRDRLRVLHLHALVLSELDERDGSCPLRAFEVTARMMAETGAEGLYVDLMSWEVARRSAEPSERVAMGLALLKGLRANGPVAQVRLPKILLEVAEAQAGRDDATARALCREAARALRRGCVTNSLYLADGLVRCARLLERSDPAEAESLVQVARRWVCQVLRFVPEEARLTFSNDVRVNRILLGGEPESIAQARDQGDA